MPQDDAPDPPVPADRGPVGLPVAVEQDRQVLAWLQGSSQLGAEVTGYICDALLDWCLSGRRYPDMAPPADNADGDHLQLLSQAVARLRAHSTALPGAARKLELGRAVRLLTRAVQAASDPQAVQESVTRELLSPAIAGLPLRSASTPSEALSPWLDGESP